MKTLELVSNQLGVNYTTIQSGFNWSQKITVAIKSVFFFALNFLFLNCVCMTHSADISKSLLISTKKYHSFPDEALVTFYTARWP